MLQIDIRYSRPTQGAGWHAQLCKPAAKLVDSALGGPLGNLSAYRYAYQCEGSRMGFHAGFVHSAC